MLTLHPHKAPAHEAMRFNERGMPLESLGLPRWARDTVPAIGDTVETRFNKRRAAVVTGYFVEEAFLGLVCRLVENGATIYLFSTEYL